ncbi:lytic transglycosylase [Sporanaerobium hydrogeniformans]|uniref:Lytic transglycosylase n=1 Tax=Sporanaerobium hydrogeniformans TaxID=3072179 RepID=A0AC61DFT8_9FIRM|nr:lytic transglycosylase domain-containing protein [Sporanaerobium hydrogeniformans]PHV71452.1 lytic transglycosylase [Sporanaerobium hydrogeniformans]
MKKRKYLIVYLVIGGCLGLLLPFVIYPRPYKQQVLNYSELYGVDPAIVYAIIKAESRYDTDAISRSGAKGLMQIMDKTGEWVAQEIGLVDYANDRLFKPDVNIQIGCWYIAKLLKQYDGDLELALAAYNAGSGHVARWRSNLAYSLDGKHLHTIPFKETEKYINKVKRYYTFYKCLYGD